VGEIERTMSQREFIDWLRFEAEWPLPDLAADRMNALICMVVANIARSSDSAPLQLADFLMLQRRASSPIEPTRVEPTPTVSTAERFRIAMYGGS
jgi:hypothetical protein